MNLLTVLNAAANTINVITITAIVIFVFGREDSPIHKDRFRAIAGKLALSTLMAGSCWNLLTLSTPAPSEILTNFGISMTFLLGAHWHYCEFIAPKQVPRIPRQIKKQPSSNPCQLPKRRKVNG
jgi:hypothetical protein